MTSIAFIGLGGMGARMARRLVDAGHDVTVWNRTTARTEPLAAAGAHVAATPAGATGAAKLTITMLADPTALRAVTIGPDGVLARLRAGSMLVEMSTVGPAAVQELAPLLPEGAGMLDAPVLGSLTEAEAGSLKVFVGGSEDLVRRARPVLEVLGEPLHVGPLGSGAAAKLVANSTLFGVLGVLGEAVALGQGLGLSREAIFDVLAATPLAAQAERRRPAIEGDDAPPRFTLALARKDAELIAEAAAAAGLDLRVAEAARSWIVDADEAGLGSRDYSAVLARMLEAAESAG